nr:zinc finger, CCHC-type [Tanacetum cinerariifolium]
MDCRSGNKKNANVGGSKKGYKDQSQDQGHVHYKRMLEMSKDDLIPAIDENPKKCNTLEAPDIMLEKTRENDDQENGGSVEKQTHLRNEALNDAQESICSGHFKKSEEGIDYFDTYALVARITTIRLLLALTAIHNLVVHQMDVKTSFLNGDLEEEVYIKQPEGFVMPDMGEANVILGIKIKLENKGTVITQSHYIEKILKKFNRKDCSTVSTPIEPVEKLMPNTVGRLRWLTSYPRRQHWLAITRVFKYLKGTLNYGLSYFRYPSVLEAYSDASWINHVEDSSSTSGWVFFLGGGAISWASNKQTCMTGSTMKYEFVGLAVFGKKAEWLRNLIHEIPIWPKPITLIFIHCDSAATLAKAYSQIYNGKSRHLGVIHSMFMELIMNGVNSIKFVRSQHNLADHLTKGLAKDLVIKSVIGMRLKSI